MEFLIAQFSRGVLTLITRSLLEESKAKPQLQLTLNLVLCLKGPTVKHQTVHVTQKYFLFSQ